MNKWSILFLAVMLFILAPGCDEETVDGAGPAGSPVRSGDLTVQLRDTRVRFTDTSPGDLQRDPVTIHAAAITDSEITLTAVFGGGCGEHAFALYMQPYFMESYPVQAALYLQHVDEGDPCDALVTRELTFDIGPIAELYRDQYGGYDRIILHVYEYFIDTPGNAVTIEYDPR